MKFTYNTNMMGPMLHWFQTNNIHYTIQIANNQFTNFQDTERKIYEQWYGGRIDIYGGPGYPDETDLPIMSGESYSRFSHWLETYSSEELKSFEELRELFESEENFKLIIFNEISDKFKSTLFKNQKYLDDEINQLIDNNIMNLLL